MSPSNPLAPQPATKIELGDLIDEKKAAKIEPGDLVDENVAAAILDTSPRTLRNWRALGKGPPYVKIGARLVRYNRALLTVYPKIVAGDAEDLT
ncbi:MAG: helix-turn-helix domain-containing protein [Rhodanobacter sp.]